MNSIRTLPSPDEMYQAVVDRDSQYEGVFFVAVKTTGIFCRPTCTARKPLRKNVDFYSCARDALAAGFRPCRRCRPMEVFGVAPKWLSSVLDQIDADPKQRWTDQDLLEAGVQPTRVRRWFKQNHGMTFHCYQRTRRLGMALGQIKVEKKNSTDVALQNGYDSISGFRDAFQNLFENSPKNSKSTHALVVNRILTPLGPMVCAADDRGVHLLEFADRRMLETQLKRLQKRMKCVYVTGDHKYHSQMQTELDEYFDGNRIEFDTPLIIEGTEFQEQVWNQLLEIEYGQTRSYDSIARSIKREGAQRAVGRANGDNRFTIVVPCHRVVRSDGSLCGYGGGLWRKKWLLEHEQKGQSLFSSESH